MRRESASGGTRPGGAQDFMHEVDRAEVAPPRLLDDEDHGLIVRIERYSQGRRANRSTSESRPAIAVLSRALDYDAGRLRSRHAEAPAYLAAAQTGGPSVEHGVPVVALASLVRAGHQAAASGLGRGGAALAECASAICATAMGRPSATDASATAGQCTLGIAPRIFMMRAYEGYLSPIALAKASALGQRLMISTGVIPKRYICITSFVNTFVAPVWTKQTR